MTKKLSNLKQVVRTTSTWNGWSVRRSGGANEEMQPHGWFVGFAPKEHPRVAFAFLVEHGRSGAASAVPVAQVFLSRFFEPREGAQVAQAE